MAKKEYLRGCQEDDFWNAVGILEDLGCCMSNSDTIVIRSDFRQDDRGVFRYLEKDDEF